MKPKDRLVVKPVKTNKKRITSSKNSKNNTKILLDTIPEKKLSLAINFLQSSSSMVKFMGQSLAFSLMVFFLTILIFKFALSSTFVKIKVIEYFSYGTPLSFVPAKYQLKFMEEIVPVLTWVKNNFKLLSYFSPNHQLFVIVYQIVQLLIDVKDTESFRDTRVPGAWTKDELISQIVVENIESKNLKPKMWIFTNKENIKHANDFLINMMKNPFITKEIFYDAIEN